MASRRRLPSRRSPGGGLALAAAIGLIAAIAVISNRRSESPRPSPLSLQDAADDSELLRSLSMSDRVAGMEAAVVQVVDGDTVVLAPDRRLRYLGIDTPELREPFHREAKEANRELVVGRRLRVLTPPPGADRDGYGRTLAAVFALVPPGEAGDAERWRCVNAELVRRGLARTYFKDDDVLTRALRGTLVAAQNRALDAGLGVWSGGGRPSGEVVATRNRFHRPSCRHLRAASSPRRMDREAALRSGRSPCRSCSP